MTKRWDPKKFKSRFAGIFFTISIVLLIACNSGSAGISQADREAFINTYIDLTLVKIKFSNRPKAYDALEANVFNRYGTSKEFMDEINKKISGDLELQEAIYRKITEKLTSLLEMPLDSLDSRVKSLEDK